MASTYSNALRLELMATGDQTGNWGNTTNTNLGTLLENSIAGYATVAVAAANQALTANNGVSDQARSMMLKLTTSTGANFAVYAPPVNKAYVVYNSTAYSATLYNSTVIGNTTAAGTGVVVSAGASMLVVTDGTDFTSGVSSVATATTANALNTANAYTMTGLTVNSNVTGIIQNGNIAGVIGFSINNANATGYAALGLASNGTSKTIRCDPNGSLAVVNAANTAEILILSDAGQLSTNQDITAINGRLTAGTTALVGETHLQLTNSGRTAYLFLSSDNVTVGLYDLTATRTRWSTNVAGDFSIAGAYSGTHLTTSDGGTCQFGGSGTSGFYSDGTNVAIRTFGNNTNSIYFQDAGAAHSYGSVGPLGFAGQGTLLTGTANGLSAGLGVNQTWQNVLGSRTNGGTYTNSTGKTIMVYVRGVHSSLGIPSIQATVASGSVEVGYAQLGQSGSGVSGDVYVMFPVPTGVNYTVTSNTGVQVWSELF